MLLVCVNAIRPATLSLSLIPTLVGAALAYKAEEKFSLLVLLASCVATTAVHAAGNLINTYYDYVHGIDKDKSDDKTLVKGILSTDQVVSLAACMYGLGCGGSVLATVLGPARLEHMAFLYFGGLSGSFLYTGGVGLKYIALGDVVVFITFGPFTVLFSYLAQTGTIAWNNVLFSIPLALSCEAVIHANNTKNLTRDKAAGFVTLAILLGPILSKLFFAVLLLSPYLISTVIAIRAAPVFFVVMLPIMSAFQIEKEFRKKCDSSTLRQIASLNLSFGLLFTIAIILTDRSSLPFLDL